MTNDTKQYRPTIEQVLKDYPWESYEEHLNDLKERVDNSIIKTNELRAKYREELLSKNPDIIQGIKRPSRESLDHAEKLLTKGVVAASDGTISSVPLLGGSKIQIGVVVVFNKGQVVDFVTKIFEAEITKDSGNAIDYFQNLRGTRKISNLLARAIMLFGERKLVLEQNADWRMLHGEVMPHELRTGAGNPAKNLAPAFQIVNEYIKTETFIAVSEASDDIDILNAATLLEPGEYFVVKTLTDVLNLFLNGDQTSGQSRANFSARDMRQFREFIQNVGDKISIVLAKASNKPFLLECHSNRIEEAVALFMTDSLWTKGFPSDGSTFTVRGFPYHIDLADQIARTLLKGSDFQSFVESRLFEIGVESGVFEMDPRKTRV
jgi:hypothetical protein